MGGFTHYNAVTLLKFFIISFALIINTALGSDFHKIPRRGSIQQPVTNQTISAPLLRNATSADIEKARNIVQQAIQQLRVHNKARVDNPRRNNWYLQGTGPSQSSGQVESNFQVTPEIAAAAALVAEADAKKSPVNGTATTSVANCQGGGGGFWMENIAHKGKWPFNSDSSFQVFRNVKTDFGAKGDGVTDDTAAINRAINSTRRCGAGCNGATTTNAIIYFPAGCYLVSGTVEVFFGTQMIGDATNWPSIIAAPSFVGLGVFSTDHYVDNGGTGPDGNAMEYYINTANFYRQIRNFKFDITATDQKAYVCAIHYQVAQATSLQYVEFHATQGDTTQQAIYAENGSGGHMSDLTFFGGNFGIYGGNQQFTAQRLTFNNVKTAVQLIWDWGWTWKSIQVNNCGTGFRLLSEDGTHRTGSIMVVDSKFSNTNTAVLTYPATNTPGNGTTGITLDNVAFSGVQDAVADNQGKVYLAGSVGTVDTWVLGPIYSDSSARGVSLGMSFNTPREDSLLGNADSALLKKPFFERSKPQYENVAAGAFVHMKDHATGDGKTDDTANFQSVLSNNPNSVIFVDAGSYILTDTILVPSGARIVGEAWSQLVAFGPKFQDASNPRPLLRVGNVGQTGNAELQDLIFTTKGATAGVILVEWNLKAENSGSAGMWDCHIRVGGAIGTDLTSKECPPATTGVDNGCSAGSMMVHITPKASAYIENFWAWVADHDIDDPDMTNANNTMIQTSIYVARGILIESTAATWLYGTASEHSTYYQYNFWQAKNIIAGMIQTESPYYQPTPKPPAPFNNVGTFPGDPTFDQNSDESWALLIRNSSNVFIAGAGIYSWFQTYNQDCVDKSNCQKSLILLDGNFGHVTIHNLITIGATNMLISDGQTVGSKENLNVNFHPYWSQIAVFDPIQNSLDPCRAQSTFRSARSPPGVSNDPPPQQPAAQFDLTIVNGSPSDFILTRNSSYQMNNVSFHDIPAGASMRGHFDYDIKTIAPVDDKAEVYYSIKGTDKKFSILIRTDWNKNEDNANPYLVKMSYDDLQTKDSASGNIFPIPLQGRSAGAASWTLTGSEKYGYWSSANPPVAWMSSIMDVIGDRKLKHVAMPGSHDAGISKLNGGTFGVNDGNCKTQALNIQDQLVRGSRHFDLRPVQGNGGKYLFGHYSFSSGLKAYVGCNGEYIEDAVTEINSFTDTNPELVILYLSHDFDSDNGYVPLNTDQWNKVLDMLEKLNNRCGGLSGDLTDYKMTDYIGNGKACVIVITEGPVTRPDKGIYSVNDHWPHTDLYTDTDDLPTMENDQIAKLHRYKNIVSGPDGQDSFFVMSWTLTQEGAEPVLGPSTIQGLSTMCDGSFPGDAWPAFTPYSYPNVLNMNFVGTTRDVKNNEILTIAMAINLEIASQNCYVGGGKI